MTEIKDDQEYIALGLTEEIYGPFTMPGWRNQPTHQPPDYNRRLPRLLDAHTGSGDPISQDMAKRGFWHCTHPYKF